MESINGDEIHCPSSLKKSKQLQKYSWNNKSLTNNSVIWPNVLDDLLKAEIISGKQLLILKEHNSVTYNPKLVMDLRHQEVKQNRLLNSKPFSKHDITEEAKRFIRSEDRKAMLQKKEQMLIDREIDALKQQLTRIRTMIKQESRSQTLHTSTHVIEKQLSDVHSCIPGESSALDVPNSCNVHCLQASNVNVKTENGVDCALIDKNEVNTVPESVFLNGHDKDMNANPEKSENHANYNEKMAQCVPVLENLALLQNAWKKWINFTSEQRMPTQPLSSPIHLAGKDLLTKYWHRWCAYTRETYHCKFFHYDKTVDPEKIDKFLKSLHEKKMKIRNINQEKSCDKLKTHLYTSHIKNKFDGAKSKVSLESREANIYEHRLKQQKNVITAQKSEIEKQNQLIDKLKLANLKLEAERSCVEASSNLRKTQSSCDVTLKAKAKALVQSFHVSCDEVSLIPNHNSTILLRMEERRKERERRWQFIKEKKKLLMEEKQKQLLKEEAEKREKEKEEKLHKIMELKENRRIERENELRKQTERQRLQKLSQKATNHYTRYLLRKYGLDRWLALITIRKHQMDIAVCHYKTKLLHQCFTTCKQFAQWSVTSKLDMAIAHYERRLLQKCFHCLLLVYDDGIRCSQVASDYYEFLILARTFSYWHQWICHQHLALAYKHARAVEQHQRRLLANCMAVWRQLPSRAQQHREKEKRKCVWRRTVQQILPDFRPPTPL